MNICNRLPRLTPSNCCINEQPVTVKSLSSSYEEGLPCKIPSESHGNRLSKDSLETLQGWIDFIRLSKEILFPEEDSSELSLFMTRTEALAEYLRDQEEALKREVVERIKEVFFSSQPSAANTNKSLAAVITTQDSQGVLGGVKEFNGDS